MGEIAMMTPGAMTEAAWCWSSMTTRRCAAGKPASFGRTTGRSLRLGSGFPPPHSPELAWCLVLMQALGPERLDLQRRMAEANLAIPRAASLLRNIVLN